jgi:hypothetical protein
VRSHGTTLQSEEEIVEAAPRLDQPLLVAGLERLPVGGIRSRHVAELLNTITHERDGPRSSDVVRSLISRMFRFGIANGHEAIEYNPASGTERALDTIPKHTVSGRSSRETSWRVQAILDGLERVDRHGRSRRQKLGRRDQGVVEEGQRR